jgi:Aspartyl protease/PDZ domain
MWKSSIIPLILLIGVTVACLSGKDIGRAQSEGGGPPVPNSTATPDSNAKSILFELNANKPYVPVRINNTGPYWFFLDSGAIFNVIDAERAKSLGIVTSGSSKASGAGEGSLTSSTGKNVSLSLNGVELTKQDVTILPINTAISSSEGRMVDGLLGYDFFNRFVVEIDYANRQINIYEPQTFKYKGEGESIPLEIERGNIFVSAGLVLPGGKRVTGKFLVDTGWRSALSLNSPFVQAQKLLTMTRTIVATTGLGVGGATMDSVGRVEGLQIGRYTIKNPVANFSKAKGGILAEDNMSGIIGGDVLRRFKVIFDYSHHRMILESTAHFDEPYKFDMSGLFLTAEGKDLKTVKVYKVIANSPGFEAGLREGDLIQAIDNVQTASMSLEQIRQMFKQEVGKKYMLRLRRGDKILKANITLRRLI